MKRKRKMFINSFIKDVRQATFWERKLRAVNKYNVKRGFSPIFNRVQDMKMPLICWAN
jgi:hypothetical protein